MRGMRLMYVFDPRKQDGYLFRAPEFACMAFCQVFRRFDYWHNP